MAQAVINQITQRIIRGAAQSTADTLNFTALSITRIGRTPASKDFDLDVDFKLTAGEVDWSLAGEEPSAGEAYFVTYTFQASTSFKNFSQVTLEMETNLNALQPNADAKTGSVARNSFIDVPGRQVTDLFGSAERIAAILSLLNVDRFTDQELDDFAFNFNESRLASTISTGFAQFNATAIITEPILVPSQSRITTLATSTQAPISFRTTADATLFPGETSVLVPIQAELSGSVGNVGSNTITIITSPILGISNVTNPNVTAGGRDQESNADFADRLRATFLADDRTTFRGIRREALAFDNVIDALVVGAGDPLLVREGGLGGKVDVYVQAEAGLDRAVTTPEDSIFAAGVDIVLLNQPVLGITQVTVNGTPSTDFGLVKDTGNLADSTRSSDAVRMAPEPTPGDTIGITYTFNGLLNDIQDDLDAEDSAIPARDLLARSGSRVFIDVTTSVVIETGSVLKDVQATVVNNVTTLINNKKLGAEITYAEIFDAIKETAGVKDVRPLALLSRAGEGTAETLQLGANEFPESGTIQVARA